MGSQNNVGNIITPPSDFCLKHSLADFREYFKLDEKSVLYNLYHLSHHYNVCRSPSLSQVVWSGMGHFGGTHQELVEDDRERKLTNNLADVE